jgi:hypothetical protein
MKRRVGFAIEGMRMRILPVACFCFAALAPASAFRATDPPRPSGQAARERLARTASMCLHFGICAAMMLDSAESVRTDTWACTRKAQAPDGGLRSEIVQRRRRATKVSEMIGTGYTPRMAGRHGRRRRPSSGGASHVRPEAAWCASASTRQPFGSRAEAAFRFPLASRRRRGLASVATSLAAPHASAVIYRWRSRV